MRGQLNNDILESSQVIMGLDEKMDEALDLLRKKNSTERAKETISNTFEENEILPDEVEFFNFENCLGKGSFGKMYMIRYDGEVHAGKVIETVGMTVPEQTKLYTSFQREFAIR